MVGETHYNFYQRAKYDLYRSLLDGTDLENASANYEFAKMNAQRHHVYQDNQAHFTFDYTTHLFLKASKWSHGKFRDLTSEQLGLSDEAWIKRLPQFKDGHNNPREAHATWPSIENPDPSEAYGSISPWELSPLMHNSEWGKPQWLQTLTSSWMPYKTKEGNLSNYHHTVLEPGVNQHEKAHSDSHHKRPSHMGALSGYSPSELYQKHFGEWLAQAPKEIQDMGEEAQRKAHLAQYQKVWAGKEPDPLGNVYESDNPNHALGFMGYALGLEWLKPEQRDDVIRHLSTHGFDDVEGKIPHTSQGWLTRNWMGRFGAGEVMHRLRGMDSAVNGIPSPYYLAGDEAQKEWQQRRRLMEAMKETMFYTKNNAALGVEKGQPAFGYFDDNGNWIHDEHHEDAHPLYAERTRGDDDNKSKHSDPMYVSLAQQRGIGVESAHDHVKNANNAKLPRHVHKYDDDGEITETNLQVHGHKIHPEDAFQSMQEFEDYRGPVLDENQHSMVKHRAEDLFGEFERRKEVMNALGPYLNMYHYMGGDTDELRMSPYGMFMSMHQASGGHASDQLNPISELHHMFHPDVWGNRGAEGLFTSPDRDSSKQFITMKPGRKPHQVARELWPAAETTEGGYDVREKLEEISAKIQGDPRQSMHPLVGFIADQPIATEDYGGTANLLAGNTRHWAQLATSFEPDYHDVYGRERPGGPLRLQGKSLSGKNEDEDEDGVDDDSIHGNFVRRTLSHVLSPGGRGRADEKRKGLLNALLLRWNERPSEASNMSTRMPDVFMVGGKPTDSLGKWHKALREYAASEGAHLIPGHPSDTDSESRIRQWMLHADIGRSPQMQRPLPLDAPASESYEQTGVGGFKPGEQSKSEADIGWLTHEGERVEPHKWHLYRPEAGVSQRGFHPEQVNMGPYGVQPHRFEFDFKQDALDAQQTGETECPVCNGEERVNPEDLNPHMKKADKPDLSKVFGDKPDLSSLPPTPKPDLSQMAAKPTKEPKVLECPNCEGSGKHKLSEDGKKAIVAPLPEVHNEMELMSQLQSWLDTPEEERRPEEWYEGKEHELESLDKPEAYSEDFGRRQREYHLAKMSSTRDLVRNAADTLSTQVRQQFKDDKIKQDPFGADENGDWSQAHVNALALWSHANELILRAHPEHRNWQNDVIHGIDSSPHIIEREGRPAFVDDMPTGAATYLPHGTEGHHQTYMKSLPMSIYNSQGYRMKYGWNMAPTFGMSFDMMDGEPTVEHNGGEPAIERKPYLNVPWNHITSVFPEMQPMSDTHPSAPSAEDRPENQKLTQHGDTTAFQLSEDEPTVSNILKALTNPDLLKDDVRMKPIKPAHRIFSLSDLSHLRGFSGDWVVSTWTNGKRAIVEKKGKKVSAQYADGNNVRLSQDMRHGLVNANDDTFCLDVIVSKDGIVVLDLLKHGHKELHDEPLKDRLTRLRSQFESTDAVLMPAPFNTRRTDDDGLKQAVSNLEDEESDGILLRDAISTYMKGEPRHPKWVLLRKENELDVIILDRRGRGPYMYRLGIGPINPEKGKALDNRAVEREGKWFMDIGTLLRERRPYNEGDYVQVSISSVSHKQRNDEDVYDIQPIKILGESNTEATDSVDTLNTLTKSYPPIIYPHDVVVNPNDVQIRMHAMQDTIVYKMDRWNDGWAIHAPISILNDLSDSDYAVQMAESVRPYWEPVVGMTLKGLVKLNYNPRETEDKGRAEDKNEEDGSHKVGFKLKKPKKMDDEQILKPANEVSYDFNKTIVQALTIIDDVLAKEKATWTGARGMGIGLGTPDSAPRGPTEITQDVNTLDYDMRERDEDKEEKPKKKSAKMTGEPHPVTEPVETNEGEKGEIRVTAEEATLEMEPPQPTG